MMGGEREAGGRGAEVTEYRKGKGRESGRRGRFKGLS